MTRTVHLKFIKTFCSTFGIDLEPDFVLALITFQQAEIIFRFNTRV